MFDFRTDDQADILVLTSPFVEFRSSFVDFRTDDQTFPWARHHLFVVVLPVKVRSVVSLPRCPSRILAFSCCHPRTREIITHKNGITTSSFILYILFAAIIRTSLTRTGTVMVKVETKGAAPTPRPRAFIGQRVARRFGGLPFHGTVDGYDAPWWHVTYDDGDEQEMGVTELRAAMDSFSRADNKYGSRMSSLGGVGGKQFIGKRVATMFEGEPAFGTVDDFFESERRWEGMLLKRRWWVVSFDDGRKDGELSRSKLKNAIRLYELSKLRTSAGFMDFVVTKVSV